MSLSLSQSALKKLSTDENCFGSGMQEQVWFHLDKYK